MFCVECGKEDTIYKDGECIDCYLKTHSFTKGPEIIDMSVCSHCSSYKFKNMWTSDLFDEVLRRVLRDVFEIRSELKKIDIAAECNDSKEGKICKVVISGFLDSFEITEEHELFIRLKKTVCDVCAKRFGGYYEAVFQIRTDKRKLSESELENIMITVEDIVESIRAKGNRGLFITDSGITHGGLDFFLSDKGAALSIVKKIQELFGGEIKQSSKNIGMKDSRQVYRMTYLLRLPSYQNGDFILFDKSFFYISSINGNKVHVLKLSNYEKKVFDCKDIDKSKVLGGNELVKEMILVNESKDEVQLMDPDSYKNFEVRKPKNLSFNTKTVKIVRFEDQIFLFDEKP